MIFRVTMKDPDSLYDAAVEAVQEELAKLEGLDEQEREILEETRVEAAKELAGIWFEYGEYLTVEIDTEKETCVVVEASND